MKTFLEYINDKENYVVLQPTHHRSKFYSLPCKTMDDDILISYKSIFGGNNFGGEGVNKKFKDFEIIRGISIDQWKQLGFKINLKEIENYVSFSLVFLKKDLRECIVFCDHADGKIYKGTLFVYYDSTKNCFIGSITF